MLTNAHTLATALVVLAASITSGNSSVVQFGGISLDFATTGAVVSFTDKKKYINNASLFFHLISVFLGFSLRIP